MLEGPFCQIRAQIILINQWQIKKYIFRYGVDFNTKIHQLYIYSDLAIYTFIGDVTAPILRVLPFDSKRENNHLHQEFVNVHYVPVAKSFID